MKSALALVLFSTVAFASHGIVHRHRRASESDTTNGGWGQAHSGSASFTQYSDCSKPSCGITTSGYTAAVNTFAFGANRSSGDACGRCFKITSNKDPYTPSYLGPFNSLVVRVTDLCPIDSNEQWCGQKTSQPLNQFGTSMHFDLCQDTQTGTAFFPSDRQAMVGTFEEVLCEGNWTGTETGSLWDGSCMANANTGLWPEVGCGNHGTENSFAYAEIRFC